MAAFNPKHLTNPDIVRTIETKRLLALLKPYANYLRGRGLSLPSARQAATLDLELLAEILETPDEAAPQDLLNVIGYIDEMATPQGMDALLAASVKAGMSYDATVDQPPADIAVQVWLFDPSIVEDQHAWYTWKSPRRMDCFQPEVGNRKDVLPLTPERVDRATSEMSDWFGGNNRSTFCKLSVRHIADRIQLSIQRGDPFQRKQAIEDDSVRNLHFRPAGNDTAMFKHGDHVLQCNSAIRRALPIYQRVFGILLFDDPEYFSDSNVFALAPLEELGEDALSWGDIDDIEGILFTQYRVDRGGRNAYAIFGADDIIEDLRERGEALTIQGRLIDATFKIKFRGTRAWRTVKLYAGNAACYTRDGNADTAEQWLMLRQFIIRSGAKVEKEVDDKALARS